VRAQPRADGARRRLRGPRARADGAARRARALTAVANQAAFVLPRPGQAQACWRALAGRARQTV